MRERAWPQSHPRALPPVHPPPPGTHTQWLTTIADIVILILGLEHVHVSRKTRHAELLPPSGTDTLQPTPIDHHKLICTSS